MSTNPNPANPDQEPRFELLQGMSDEILMKKVVANDQAAFMLLYTRYSRLVFTIALHVLGSPDEAEDTLQDVFLRIWRRPGSYNPAYGSLPSWVTVVARHSAIDTLRKRKNESPLPDEVGGDSRDHNVMEALAEISRIRSILARLPCGQREALDLAYFGGLTHHEISTLSGIPLGTVKSRIRMALHSLRKLLLVDAN